MKKDEKIEMVIDEVLDSVGVWKDQTIQFRDYEELKESLKRIL